MLASSHLFDMQPPTLVHSHWALEEKEPVELFAYAAKQGLKRIAKSGLGKQVSRASARIASSSVGKAGKWAMTAARSKLKKVGGHWNP